FVHEAKLRQFSGRILTVTAGVSDSAAVQYVQSGDAGILHKHNPPEALWNAVRKVAGGEVHLEPGDLEAMSETINAPDESTKAGALESKWKTTPATPTAASRSVGLPPSHSYYSTSARSPRFSALAGACWLWRSWCTSAASDLGSASAITVC